MATTVTVNTLSLANGTGLASNYTMLAGQSAVAHITPKTLTAIASASDKIYDGSTLASASLTGLSGLISTETVTASATNATFNSQDVATATTVTVNALSLSDGSGLASNYAMATGHTATAHITPKTLTATAVADDKVYDGNTDAAAQLTITAGLVGTETVSAAVNDASFNSKNVTTAAMVTVNALMLADGSGLASNYALASGQTAAAQITRRALTATATANDKIYDGDDTATASLNLLGLVGMERLIATPVNASFNSKDVASATTVTVHALSLADDSGLASNYALASGQTAAARITPKTLNATAIANDKIYDGSDTADAQLTGLSGFFGAETVTAIATSASFNTKDVATANAVIFHAVSLFDGTGGGLGSNYALGSGQVVTARITPKPLTATATASDKIYDANDIATATLALSGLVGMESLRATASNARFNSQDVTTASFVTVNAVSLADGDNGGIASNYALSAGQIALAKIMPADNQAPILPANPAPTIPNVIRIVAPVASASSSRSGGNADATATEGGGLNAPKPAGGIISILIPRGASTSGARVLIPLPDETLKTLNASDASETVRVSLPDNKPLPGWIKYMPAEKAFVTDSVPEGALPMLVELTIGTQRSLIQIAELP